MQHAKQLEKEVDKFAGVNGRFVGENFTNPPGWCGMFVSKCEYSNAFAPFAGHLGDSK